MKNNKFSGSAQITDEGIKKHFKSYEPIKAIFELVWNGLDAEASKVNINIKRNGLDGLKKIEICDDGEGFDIKNAKDNFEKFNDSDKKHDDDKHGSHGKGRLAFHKLCDQSTWYTKHNGYNAQIVVKSSNIKDYNGEFIEDTQQHKYLKDRCSGTCVELVNFTSELADPEKVIELLSKEFGWFLELNKLVSINLNGKEIGVPSNDLSEKEVEIDGNKFTFKVIRWDCKPSSEKSYNYLIKNNSKVVLKQLSSFNYKSNFYLSSLILSDWVKSYNPYLLEMGQDCEDQNKILKRVLKSLLEFQNEVYADFLRASAEREVEKFDENGFFPSYANFDKGYAEWRKNNTKKLLKDIYIADPQVFNSLNGKQTKIIIRLLDAILVSNENDSIFEVLEGVLDLNDDEMGAFAKQLNKTTLKNIISTIETLQHRQNAVNQLKEIMINRYHDILETPDLQKIIEANTWLFGSQYTTLGAEEDDFNKIAKNLRSSIKDIDDISESDIDEGTKLEGVKRQVDLFLARKIPFINYQNQKMFKCIIIEIKRPGLSLNKKHLQQLDDYAEIIAKNPTFSSDKLVYELVLVGRKISKDDIQIKSRLDGQKNKLEYGLVTDNEKIKCYVKDWFTIFDEFELSNEYLLTNLNSKLEDLTERPTDEMVSELQKIPA